MLWVSAPKVSKVSAKATKPSLTQAWKAPEAAPGMPSPLAVSGCVYVLNGNVLYCLDAATGKEHYKKRLPGFRTVVASPISCADRILILDEAGHALVLQAGPKFQILGQPRLEDRFWASPAAQKSPPSPPILFGHGGGPLRLQQFSQVVMRIAGVRGDILRIGIGDPELERIRSE